MVESVEGVYRNGKVELIEPITEADGSRVIVTWVHPPPPVDWRERGIDESQAADLRRRLGRFTEDWDRPEMIVAMITSNMARTGRPSRITVLASSESARLSGLLTDCMTDNLATVHYSEIGRAIGSSPGTAELDASLRATLAM